MKYIFTVLCSLTISSVVAQQKLDSLTKSVFTIGETWKWHSEILDESREVNVYLPLGYSPDSSKSYPVIYLLDGSKDEDFIHVSGIVQFGSFSWINTLPESIVVGIGNVDRKKDFTYPSGNELDKKEFPSAGHSEQFIQFIASELQPFIDSTYHTNSTRTVIGQSLGGLLATEILFKFPDLFDNYIIVSPSLWWDDEKLLDMQPKELSKDKSIYIAVGHEGPIMERTAKELYLKLQKAEPSNPSISFDFLEDKSHGDALHQAVYNAFEAIFNRDIKKP